jgi:type II pantothenate kinase
MLVGDIYGGSYDKFGLNASVCASAFGKLVMKDAIRRTQTTDSPESPSPSVDSVKQQEALRQGIADADIARALLNMVGHNIAQLAYLVASQQKVNRVLFCGNFLRRNNVSMASLSLAIDYWSRGEMKALFLKHEGSFFFRD